MNDPQDAADLELLRLWRAKTPVANIARQLGVSRGRVITRVARLITEDCLADPTAHAYWRRTKETPR